MLYKSRVMSVIFSGKKKKNELVDTDTVGAAWKSTEICVNWLKHF